jgi:hypothetical protein
VTIDAIISSSTPWARWPGRWGGSAGGGLGTPSPVGPANQGTKWSSPEAFSSGARDCSTLGADFKRAARPSPARPPRPRVRATKRGRAIYVSYRFNRLPQGSRRPAYLTFLVRSRARSITPRGTALRVRKTHGRVRILAPRKRGRFELLIATKTRRGVESRVRRILLPRR